MYAMYSPPSPQQDLTSKLCVFDSLHLLLLLSPSFTSCDHLFKNSLWAPATCQTLRISQGCQDKQNVVGGDNHSDTVSSRRGGGQHSPRI